MNKLFAFLLVGIVLITVDTHAQNTLKRSPEVASYHSAIDLVRKGKYASAQQQFEEIEKSTVSPLMEAEVQFYIALCALNLEQPQAEQLFLEFIDENPSDPKMNLAYYQMGEYYYRKQKFNKAAEYLAQVDLSFLDEKDRFEAEFDLGYSYFVKKKLPEAEKQFDRIKNKDHNYKYAANYYSGYIKFLNKEYDAAVRDLKVAEENGVYGQIVPYMIVNIYYKKADYDQLVRYSEPVLKSDKKVSKKKEILLLTAESYFMLKDYPKAGKYFDIYIKNVGTGNKEVTYRAGYSALKNEETQKSIDYFKEIADTKDSLGQYASYYLGESYLVQGNKLYALAALKEASKADFNKNLQEAAMFDVARLYYELEQFDNAISAFNAFDVKYPNSSKSTQTQELLSDAYVYTNDYDAALKYLESKPTLTVKMRSNYQQMAYQKSLDLYNKKQYQDALVFLDKSIAYPESKEILSECYYWKGEVYSRLKQWGQATNAYSFVFRNLSERSLTFIKTRYGVGYAYFNQKDYKKAKEHFTKFIASSKKTNEKITGDAMLRLADCYYLEKKYNEALTRYQGAIDKKVPGIDYAYYQLGLVYEAADNIAEAENKLAFLEKNYPTSPLRVKASYNRARIAFEDGQYERASTLFNSYLTKFTNDKMVPFALLQRGKTFYNLNKLDASIADYDRILKEYCLDEVATEALSGVKQSLDKAGKGGEFDGRLSDFQTCNPNNESIEKIRFEAAESSYRSSDNKVAANSFTQFLKDYPKSSYTKSAIYYLADSYYGLKNYDSSIVYYKQVVTNGAEEHYEKGLIKLSRMLVNRERFSEAKDVSLLLLNAASSRRKQGEALSTLIVSLFNLEMMDSTLVFTSQVISDPATPDYMKMDAYYYSAKANFSIDSLDAAMDQFLYIVNNSTDVRGAESNYNVGLVLFKQGKYKQSLEVLYQLNKTFGTYDFWLGKSFLLIAENNLALGEDFQARATLQSLIDYSSNALIVEEAKTRLKTLDDKKASENIIEEEVIEAVDLHAPEDQAIQQVDSSNVENK